MLDLSLRRINDSSPYKVSSLREDVFSFIIDNNVAYEIGFIEDYMLGISGVYQFFITPNEAQRHKDAKVSATIIAVMEEFFQDGNLILDYVCDTHDGRQAARRRLFKYWYNSHPLKIGFTQQDIIAVCDGVSYYAAVVLRNDNPRYLECMDAIADFSENIVEKLQ